MTARTLTDQQTWAYRELGAVIDNPGNAHIMRVAEGPTRIPVNDPRAVAAGARFQRPERDARVHRPADYGRYEVIDMDRNNAASIDAWCERNPDLPRPVLGYGICRAGFGLQPAPLDKGLSREDAERWAHHLNAQTPPELRDATVIGAVR